MYVKVFDNILDSSVWEEPHATVRVWLAFLCMADENGVIQAVDSAIRKRAGGSKNRAKVTDEEWKEAISTLESPDIESKDKDYGGRRIERIEGGWLVLNKKKYRDIRTRKQMQDAERQRRHRAKKRDTSRESRDVTTTVSVSASGSKGDMGKQEDLREGGESEGGKQPSLAMVRRPTKGHPIKAAELQLAIDDIANRQLAGTKLRQAQVVVIFAYWMAKTGRRRSDTELSMPRFNRIEHHLKERGASWCLYNIDGSLKNKRLNQKDGKFHGLDNIFPYQNTDRMEESVALSKFSRQPIHAMVVEHPEIQTAEERETLAPQQGGGHE